MSVRAEPATHRPVLSVAIVLTAAFLVMADSSIANVAIPVLGTDLGATFGEAQLVVAAYQITYAAPLIIGGRLGDRFGRRRLFLLGLAGVVVASIGCGLAPDPTAVIGVRAAQGAAAAMMFPQTLSVIQVVVPRARPVALAVFGATGSVATIAGPLICGLLIRADVLGLSWRPAFLVNLPVGAVGLLMARRFLPESRSEHIQRAVDDIGSRLTELHGIGAVLAGTILAAPGQPAGSGRRRRSPASAGWRRWKCRPATFVAIGYRVPGTPTQPRTAHHGDHPDPTRHRRTRLLPTQTCRGQAPQRSAARLKRRLADVVYRAMIHDTETSLLNAA